MTNFNLPSLPLGLGQVPFGLPITELGLTADVPANEAYGTIYGMAYAAAQEGVPAYAIRHGNVFSPVDGETHAARTVVYAAMSEARRVINRAQKREVEEATAQGRNPVLFDKPYTPYYVPVEELAVQVETQTTAKLRARVTAAAGKVVSGIAERTGDIRWPTRRAVAATVLVAALGTVTYDVGSVMRGNYCTTRPTDTTTWLGNLVCGGQSAGYPMPPVHIYNEEAPQPGQVNPDGLSAGNNDSHYDYPGNTYGFPSYSKP